MTIKIKISSTKKTLNEGKFANIISFGKQTTKGSSLENAFKLELPVTSGGVKKKVNMLDLDQVSNAQFLKAMDDIASKANPAGLANIFSQISGRTQSIQKSLDEISEIIAAGPAKFDNPGIYASARIEFAEMTKRLERMEEALETLTKRVSPENKKNARIRQAEIGVKNAKGSLSRARKAHETRIPDVLKGHYDEITNQVKIIRNPDETLAQIQEFGDNFEGLKKFIDEVDDDVTREMAEQLATSKQNGIPDEAVNRTQALASRDFPQKTQEFGSTDFDEITREFNVTPSTSATPTPIPKLGPALLENPTVLKLDREYKAKLIRYAVAAGLLAAVSGVVINKFMNTPGQTPPAGATPPAQPGQPATPTTPTNTPATPTQPSQPTQPATPAAPANTPATPAQQPAAAAAKPGSPCKDENQFRKLSASAKIDCGIKNQRYIDFAKAYREARSLVGNIVKSVVLDSDMLNDVRAATQNQINPDLIIKHVLNDLLPMRGILIRYGMKQIKKRDALTMALNMKNAITLALDPSEQVVPFSLPGKMGQIGAKDKVTSFLKEIDRQINRKDLIRAIERALDEHLKPWTPISKNPVDYDPKAAEKFANISKLPEQNEKTYDLEFSKWKKMFL